MTILVPTPVANDLVRINAFVSEQGCRGSSD